MNKFTFKQCLNAIDRLEIQGLSPAQLKDALFERMQERIAHLTYEDIDILVDTLLRHNLIRQFGNITDLSVPLTIFARSSHNSIAEAISFCESLFQEEARHELFYAKYDKSFSQHDIDILFKDCACFEEIIFEVELFDYKQGRYFVKRHIKPLLQRMNLERVGKPLISSVSLAYFIKDMTRLKDIAFRNQHLPVVRYMNMKLIMTAIPYQGIPEKRDASEGLQSFFKDTLFHEFKHQCAICSINIPQMLIASHIKPFRDCGHLIEAADQNNGILLCRNHDFLFDQGYISFDMDGMMMVSSHLSQEHFQAYQVSAAFQLNETMLTPMRKQFLDYHVHEYFRR